MYLVFEGVDGVGKSTQANLLQNTLKNVIRTQEPGATKLGESLREILLGKTQICNLAEFFLFLADRAEHIEKVIKPNLDKIIISDRSLISGMAYARANDESLELEFLINLNKFSTQDILPDKVVLFEATKELLSQRLAARKLDKIEQRGIEFLLKVQENMYNFTQLLNIPTLKINASESIDLIHTKIKGFLDD